MSGKPRIDKAEIADKARLNLISFLFTLTHSRVMKLYAVAYSLLMEQLDEDEAREKASEEEETQCTRELILDTMQ